MKARFTFLYTTRFWAMVQTEFEMRLNEKYFENHTLEASNQNCVRLQLFTCFHFKTN